MPMISTRRSRVIHVEATASEAKAIELALAMPDMRATAIVVGLMAPFSHSARERMFNYVISRLAEKAAPGAKGGQDHE